MKRVIGLAFMLLVTLQAEEIYGQGSLKIKTAFAKRTDRLPLGEYLGTYSYPPFNYTILSAHVEGFIEKITVEPGQKVKKREKLFVIKSPKLLDMQSEYIDTLIESEFYEKEIKRLQPLAKKGVIASKEYLKNKNIYEKLKASLAFKQNILRLYGVSDLLLQKIAAERMPYPYTFLYADIGGIVVEVFPERGSFVAEGEKLARFVDPQTCYLELRLPWRSASQLHAGEKLFSRDLLFHVHTISPQVEERTQTKRVILKQKSECKENAGATINRIFYKKTAAWKIPSSAVVSLEQRKVLFVRKKRGFRPVNVKVLAKVKGFCYIDADIKQKDEIAVSSVMSLKNMPQGKQE